MSGQRAQESQVEEKNLTPWMKVSIVKQPGFLGSYYYALIYATLMIKSFTIDNL